MNASPYSQIARQFMELWQKQMAAMATDQDFIQSMLDMMRTMQMPAAAPEQYAASHAAPAAHAAPAHDALLERVDRLEHRIRVLEKRLAELEPGPAARAGAGKSRKRGTGAAGGGAG